MLEGKRGDGCLMDFKGRECKLISPGGARKLVDLDQGFAVRLQGESSSVKKLGTSAKGLSELVRDCGEVTSLWSVLGL